VGIPQKLSFYPKKYGLGLLTPTGALPILGYRHDPHLYRSRCF
jgi:hypothetical protein